MSIRVAIVEDDAEMRKLTAGVLNLYPDMECVGAFEDGTSYLENESTLRPDVVLMDVELTPDMSGPACVYKSRAGGSTVLYVMYTVRYDWDTVFEALQCGAKGYLNKGGTPEQLANAIREVAQGGSPMSAPIARMILDYVSKSSQKSDAWLLLTPQEQKVLEALKSGMAMKQIAAELFVSEATVKTQARSIYQKLEVHSRTEALNKVWGR